MGDFTDGSQEITRIEPEVSVNEKGKVVFVGELNGNAENVLLGDGRYPVVDMSQSPPGFNWSFAQINNQDIIVARVLRAGQGLVGTWRASNPGDRTIIASTTLSPFTQLTLPVIGNSRPGQQPIVGFLGRQWNFPFNYWSNDTGERDVQALVSLVSGVPLAHFRSMAAQTDKRTFVLQFGIAQNDGRVVVWRDPADLDLWEPTLLASTASPTDPWVSIGRFPGISDSGKFVAFGGTNPQGARGIYLSVLDPASGYSSIPFRIWADDTPIALTEECGAIYLWNFDFRDNRVGIVHQELGAPGLEGDCLVIAFVATPTEASRPNPALPDRPLLFTENPGIWVFRVEIVRQLQAPRQLLFQPTQPICVMQEGTELDGAAVVDLALYDPLSVALADTRGRPRTPGCGDHYIAFSAAMDINEDGLADENWVFRGAKLDTDEDGLMDHWEEEGIDMDADGWIDLHLAAMGADPLRKDIFLEIDWFNERCDGILCELNHWNNEPAPGVTERLAEIFAEAPVENVDGSSGITLHMDAGYGKDAMGKPFSVNFHTLKDGGNEIAIIASPTDKHIDVAYFWNVEPFTLDGVLTREFQDIKETYFSHLERGAREIAFKYCVLGDFLDVLYKSPGVPFTGRVTGQSSFTLTSDGANFRTSPTDLRHHSVKIISGRGAGQIRRIASNTDRQLTIEKRWAIVPDSTSTFVLLAGNTGQAEESIYPPPYFYTRPGNDMLIALGAFGANEGGWLGNGDYQMRIIAHELGRSMGLLDWETDPAGLEPNYRSIMNHRYLFDLNSGVDSYADEDWAKLKYDFHLSAHFIGNTCYPPPVRAPVAPYPDLTPPGIVITSPEDDCGFSVGLGETLTVTAEAWDDIAIGYVVILFDIDGDGEYRGQREVAIATYDVSHGHFRATFPNISGPFGARYIIAYAYDTSGNMGKFVRGVEAGGDDPGAQTLLYESGAMPFQPDEGSGGTRQTATHTSINVPGSGRLNFTVTSTPAVRQSGGGGNRHDSTVTRIWLNGEEFSLEPVCNPPGCDPAVCTSFWNAPPGGGSLDVEVLGPAVFDEEGNFLGNPRQDYTLKISFVAVDMTPPEITITSPPEDGFVGTSEALEVEMTVVDDYGVALVEVSFDISGDGDEDDASEFLVASDLGGGNYRATFPNVAGDTGARAIRVVASDTSGLAARETRFVEVRVPDTEPPTVQIKSPPAGWPIEQDSTLRVEVSAYDDVELSSVTVAFDIDGNGTTIGFGETVVAEKTGVNLFTAEFPSISGPNGSRTVSVLAADTSMNTSPAEIPVTVGGVEPVTETIFTDSGHIDAQPSVWSGGYQQIIEYDPIDIQGSGTVTFIVTATPPVRHENQNIPRADPYVRNINFNGVDYSLNADCNDFGADPSICTTAFEATEGGTLDFELLGPGTWNIWGEFSGHHEQDYTLEIEFTSVDITRPDVTVTSPELGANLDFGAPLTVELSVADEGEIASVVVSFDVDGDGDTDGFGEQLAATTTGGDDYQADFGDLSGIPGTRSIEVMATDASFNTTRKSQTVGVGGVGGGEMVLASTSGTIPAQPSVWQGGERQIIGLDPIVVPGMGRITFVVTATPNVRQEVQNIQRYDSTVTNINFEGGDITLTPDCNAPGSDPAVCVSVWDAPSDGVLDPELLGPATYNTWGEFSGHGAQDYTIEVLFLPGPMVTEVIPDTGSVGGHETVTVMGSGFDYNVVVLFGEVPGMDVVWVSSEELACTTPPGLPGSATVRVLNSDPEGLGWNYGGPYGLFGELENGFTYESAPPPQPLQAERLLGTYKDYFPAVGSEEPQQQASFDFNIPGAGRLRFEAWAFIPILNPIPGPFDNPENLEWHNESTAVRFFTGGNGAGHWPQIEYSDLSYPFGPVTANSTRVIGSEAAGSGQLTVKGPARWNAFWRQFGEYEMISAPAQNWSLAVWYAEPPSLASVGPTSGSEAGGTTVTLSGGDFAEGTQVLFDGVPATDVVVSSETTLTCKTPPGLAGQVSVEIDLLGMTAALPNAFTYVPDDQRQAITGFTFDPQTENPTVAVQTLLGRTYQLQRNENLTDPFGWVNVGGQVSGSGWEEFVADNTPPYYSPRVFYRFVIREYQP